jgi:hypothetical protein
MFNQVLSMLMAATVVLQVNGAWATADAGETNSGCKRAPLHLTIDSAEQLPAAEAVIAAMYAVPASLFSLQQQELVCALLIAIRIGAADIALHCLSWLTGVAEQGSMSEAAMEALASLPVWPACLCALLPSILAHAPCCNDRALADLAAIAAADTGSRVQRMLLAVLGDLEAV